MTFCPQCKSNDVKPYRSRWCCYNCGHFFEPNESGFIIEQGQYTITRIDDHTIQYSNGTTTFTMSVENAFDQAYENGQVVNIQR